MIRTAAAFAVIAFLSCAQGSLAGGPRWSTPDDVADAAPAPTKSPRLLDRPLCSGRAASGFGYRVDPMTQRFAFHAGLDFMAEFGTPVRASAAGTVIAAETRGPYGRMIDVDHGGGLTTRYAQLRSIDVIAGDRVGAGQVLATVGSSGRSEGPHLHFEVWFEGKVWDPLKFLPLKAWCRPEISPALTPFWRQSSAADERFVWPVCGPVTRKFGYRENPKTRRIAFHSGVDLGERAGLVQAAAAGRVLLAAEQKIYGLVVEIDHGRGFRTHYGHLGSYSVASGQIVAQGQVIGTLGATGATETPAFHFEIWLNNVARDPLEYLERETTCAVPLP